MSEQTLATMFKPRHKPKVPYALPWLMCSVSTIIFVVMVIIPMGISLLLSFNQYDPDLGAIPYTFTFENFINIFNDSVITSYSIHYTKLYESPLDQGRID